jgi:hypothetical protein
MSIDLIVKVTKMRIGLSCLGSFLFLITGTQHSANAQNVSRPPTGCIQVSEEWNGTARKTAIYFTNSCQQSLNVSLVTGNNGRWRSLLLVHNVKTYALFYKEDVESLGGVTPYPCYSPAYPVDDQNYKPVTTLNTPYLCRTD